MRSVHVGVIVVGLSTAACSSDEPTLRDQLIGSWTLVDTSISNLSHLFNEDGSFEMNYFSFDLTQVQIEAHVGTFELRDGEAGALADDGPYLFTLITHSTCSNAPRSYGEFAEVLANGSLRLTNPSFALVFEPISDSAWPVSLTATLGCFAEGGTFNPGPIQEL